MSKYEEAGGDMDGELTYQAWATNYENELPKIKPCPFCGGEGKTFIRDWDDGTQSLWIECQSCGAEAGHCGNEQEAIEAWNTRAGCKDCAALNRAAGLWAKADKRARELERTCRMTQSDYYPCAEDDCMRLSMRMWMCSECEADYVGSKPNYCPNCGAKVVDA